MRCPWSEKSELLKDYHDDTWGKLVTEDTQLFGALVLEMMQAGLSFETVLKKKRAYEELFFHWDLKKISQMTSSNMEDLMTDARIIRHRKKLEAIVTNAKKVLKIQEEFGSFYRYLKDFFKKLPVMHFFETPEEIPSTDETTIAISKDLKKRGFSFVGPTTIYAFLQSVGFYNDHLTTCFLRETHVEKIKKVTKNMMALFLEAEPDRDLVKSYLKDSLLYALYDERQLKGGMALFFHDKTIEIKNLAISPEDQGNGYGNLLLTAAKDIAEQRGYQTLVVQTGSTTFDALKLYQRFGFRIIKVIPDYFTTHYKVPLVEYGIPLKDALYLEMILS